MSINFPIKNTTPKEKYLFKYIFSKKIILFSAFFIAFSGYYIALILLSNLGKISYSLYITTTIRFILLSLIFLVFIKNSRKNNSIGIYFFIIFSIIYILKIFFYIPDYPSYYKITPIIMLLYFISFFLLPFLLIFYTNFNKNDYQTIYRSIFYSSLIFCILVLIFYNQYLGETTRISLAIEKDENYISPLTLSYISTILIVFCFHQIFIFRKNLIISFISLGVSIIPFFLGASRGSVISILFLLIFHIFATKNLRLKIYISIALVLSIVFLSFLSEYFQSSLWERITSLSEDIKTGSTSSIRLNLWSEALNIFSNNPFLGKNLLLESTGFHPHNILVESLMTTGIFGFLALLSLIFISFYRAIIITRYYTYAYWIVALFLISLIQNMFSGSIYTASWFSLSCALLLSFKPNEKKN